MERTLLSRLHNKLLGPEDNYLSKLVHDFINELNSLDEVNIDFELFVMNLNIDNSGEVLSCESVLPVLNINIDLSSNECLFQIKDTGTPLSVENGIKALASINFDYSLCSSFEENVDNSIIRIDNPIIGFGENIEEKRFFVVCQA